jgi:outer membrane protein TolC
MSTGMLRRRVLASLLMAASTWLPANAEPEPLGLSLDQALERGMDASLALQQSEAEKQAATAGVGLSRSLFLPKLDVVGPSGQLGWLYFQSAHHRRPES